MNLSTTEQEILWHVAVAALGELSRPDIAYVTLSVTRELNLNEAEQEVFSTMLRDLLK